MYGGKTTVNAGTSLSAPNVILYGGTLAGFGTINGNVLNVAGTIAPGDPGQTRINGDVNLNGTLRIDLINGFVPTSVMSFRILQWTGTLTGNFAAMIFPVFGNLTFTQVINANDITLLVSETPEPATFGLGFALLAAGLWIRQRRRQA